MADFITLPAILADCESDKYISPENYTYWKARENRTFYIDYEIEEDYSLIELSKIIIQMNIEEKDIPQNQLKPVFLYIFSYGGDLDQAFSAIDILTSSRIPIVTVNMGISMSAGFLLLLAGSRRYTLKHARGLVHSGSAGFQGTAEQIEQAQKDYKQQLEQMKDFILERTTIDSKLFQKNKTKDWYLSADEQLQYHVVDKIINSFDEII